MAIWEKKFRTWIEFHVGVYLAIRIMLLKPILGLLAISDYAGFLSVEFLHVNISEQCVNQPQIAKFMGPTWDPAGSRWPQMGPMLAP